jgi:hypothetical protein
MDARGAKELRDYIVKSGSGLPEEPRSAPAPGVPPIYAWVGVEAPPRPVEGDQHDDPQTPRRRRRFSSFLARFRRSPSTGF